jgi:hypothetical protein
MLYFQTKNNNLYKFWRLLQWKMLVYFMTIWSILRSFGIFFLHLVYLKDIWIIFFPVLVCCTKKKLATLDSGLLSLNFFRTKNEVYSLNYG